MNDFEVIDAHVHLVRNLEEEIGYFLVLGRRTYDRWATPERAIEYMDRAGISAMAVMNLIPRQFRGPLEEKRELVNLPEAKQREKKKEIGELIASVMRQFNEWGCEMGQRFPRLHPFSCVSPDIGDAEAVVQEVALRASQGAKGVKLHPGIFSFYPDDENLWPMYEKCQELGLPIVADSGPFPLSPVLTMGPYPIVHQEEHVSVDYGEPKNFARVLEAFPRLTLVLAHLGSAWWDERVELAQRYPNVYFDTSQGFAAPDRLPIHPHRGLAEVDTVRIIRKVGVERVMFGTDFPAFSSQLQLEQITRLPFTDEEKKMILAKNARRILKI